jgi:hypothetical protein
MRRLAAFGFVLVVFTSCAWGQEPASNTTSCAALAKLNLPNTKIVKAETVAAGAMPAPQGMLPSSASAEVYKRLPAFCRVMADLAPSADSDIKIEVWLPLSGWNGKFRGQGNGGFAGEIDYDNLAFSLTQGYATGGTDTGHAAPNIDASWALGHPEKVADFGYRAIHEMTQKSLAIVAAYYGSSAKRSYFASCSDGGREALMEAQRFPADYDGILAGAPANNWSRLLTNAAHNAQGFMLDRASYISPAKLAAISSAVVAACDAADGVSDGILNDPRQCRFDPAAMLCKQGDSGLASSDQCLTASQVAAMKSLYAGAHDSAGKLVFPGYLPGSEVGFNGWATWITGPVPDRTLMLAFGYGYFSDMVYGDSKWDLKSFNVDDGLKAAVEKTSQALDSTNPDLKPFADRGGKLILYHGWNDPAISALNTIDYYQNVLSVTGEPKTESFVRLYMAPGVQHCLGGPGPDSFGQFGWTPNGGPNDPQHDMYSALEQWVEKGVAPDKVIATKYEGEGSKRHQTMTRPLCPFPEAAKYKGSGDTSDAANFVCAAPAI